MQHKHKPWGGMVALAASLALAALPGTAQNYPTKPVRVIVGFAPGGATDIIARMISPRLTAAFVAQLLGQLLPDPEFHKLQARSAYGSDEIRSALLLDTRL